jgi:hypothetical protein
LAPFEHMVWDDKGPFQVRSIVGAIYILWSSLNKNEQYAICKVQGS